MNYKIYQLKHEKEPDMLRFREYAFVRDSGVLNLKNYECMYESSIETDFTDSLNATGEKIYCLLNGGAGEHPVDYGTYSLSMSDIIVLGEGEGRHVLCVDSFGFASDTPELKKFLSEVREQEKHEASIKDLEAFIPPENRGSDSIGKRIAESARWHRSYYPGRRFTTNTLKEYAIIRIVHDRLDFGDLGRMAREDVQFSEDAEEMVWNLTETIAGKILKKEIKNIEGAQAYLEKTSEYRNAGKELAHARDNEKRNPLKKTRPYEGPER